MLVSSHWPSEYCRELEIGVLSHLIVTFCCVAQSHLLVFVSFSVEVLATLTSDVGRILSKLHQVQPNGSMNLLTGIRIAHVSLSTLWVYEMKDSRIDPFVLLQLALKHRQGKNHKMRIVVFVGSPITADEKDLVKLAKRLKKEKVNVDLVSFGEELSVSFRIKISFTRVFSS